MKVSTTAGSRKAASEGDPRSHYNCPMFAAGKLIFLIASITSGLRASASLVQQQNGTAWSSANSSTDAISPDVSECVLLFGAFCNGNLGDVIQASTMSRLVTKVASDSTCIWHAHPSKEKMANGFREGEFFANNSVGIIPLGCDRESGEQVSHFKGLVIGGGGLLEARHWPLDCEAFVEGLGDEVPVAVFAVGASFEANWSWPILERANYVSGRDRKSVTELSLVLSKLKEPRVRPQEVARVRDPVLSDDYFKDIDGACWNRSEGSGNSTQELPLCFILPAAVKPELQEFHRVLSSDIVSKDDILLNVFPKHQAEIEAYPYLSTVEPILDPEGFSRRLCACKAVVTSRLHGAILSLQAGIPTIAAWPSKDENKVPDLMRDVLRFPDQFVLVQDGLTRKMLIERVDKLVLAYASGRREVLFNKLDFISRHTLKEASLMLERVVHLPLANRDIESRPRPLNMWNVGNRTPYLEEEEIGKAVEVAAGHIAEMRLSGQQTAGGSHDEKPWRPDMAVPFPWWKHGGEAWGVDEGAQATGVGVEMYMSGSPLLGVGTIVLIALLGLPQLVSLIKDEATSSTAHMRGASAAEAASKSLQTELTTGIALSGFPVLGKTRLPLTTLAFFGLNYVMWVVLSVGFSICSKTYMRETRNPMALLAIQGWIGIAILCAMNGAAQYRRRSAGTPPSSEADLVPSSSMPSWSGKCGLRQMRRVGRNIWQAGLLHSGNAVLTSWSVLVGGVAATHALKALEPIAAAGFSRWLLGSKLPLGRALAITIIVVGLAILMVPLQVPRWVSGSEDPAAANVQSEVGSWEAGMNLVVPASVTACACCAVALRNVLLKRPDPPPPPPPLGLLVCSVVGAGVGSFSLLVPLVPFSWEWAGEPLLRVSGVNAALCFVGYNLASFNLLSELSPVGHAVGNASKRVCLFATGLFLLGEEESMSPRQLLGASVAFVGLASYNLAGARALSASPSSR